MTLRKRLMGFVGITLESVQKMGGWDLGTFMPLTKPLLANKLEKF